MKALKVTLTISFVIAILTGLLSAMISLDAMLQVVSSELTVIPFIDITSITHKGIGTAMIISFASIVLSFIIGNSLNKINIK
ncbi:hypothetical protein [Thalassobacillus sp. B23F22_16]|uniref:hypothetical protein n=1 Tax=Thalassobacillus sp. B23F22_16 TaxID=3459513 RepID=UPI00373FC0BB